MKKVNLPHLQRLSELERIAQEGGAKGSDFRHVAAMFHAAWQAYRGREAMRTPPGTTSLHRRLFAQEVRMFCALRGIKPADFLGAWRPDWVCALLGI